MLTLPTPRPLDNGLRQALQTKIDQKTKPLGALGELEKLALRVGLIQNSLTPTLQHPTVVIFAGDHGATTAGVSAYPSDVTAQMVLNFLNRGAAINVFAENNGLSLRVVDVGVAYDFPRHDNLTGAKVAPGTANYVAQPAMSEGQCREALTAGAEIVENLNDGGCNVVGFGEMGIGNTASAALLMALLCGLPLARCVGAGAGLDADGIARKTAVLEQARQRIEESHGGVPDPLTVLAEAGGLEIAALCGALLAAANRRMVILVDGFIVSAALLVAHALRPAVLDYCVFSHCSDEAGHLLMLEHFGAKPLLDLNLRLGEGSGGALAYPLLRAAVDFLDRMASFESAGVSGKTG